ncbi:penicillin-binding protein [Naumannella halotolerans]|uniref:Membrane peptidoglycan carboxypeptidase n=1 Tax=Naumannella halotolerans TaxID=993414 RepID=A0A4R7J0U9_9ACTN|nr:penicillin-binding protein [Naumannella halotolerans]TDT29859.1 membrane peptidoglycan carboxypeptidase [Naumannella halotolerans]
MSNRSGGSASLLYSLSMFGVVSVICGVLVAGLMVPFAALATAGARAGVTTVQDLPEELVIPAQGQRTSVYMANGEVLANFYEEYRIYKPLDEISPYMKEAQLAIEDHRFYEHGPLDVVGTLRALLTNVGGGDTQGGSSITQQYVKMAQIDIAKRNNDEEGIRKAQEQTIARKVQELRYAIALERELSKDEIFERYLNIAYYGSGAYGVEAAAKTYFNKSAKDLDLAESAMLAGMVQNPTATDPANNVEATIERRNVVLNRMASPDIALITVEEANEAKAEEYDPADIRKPINDCVNSRYPFLCDYVKKTITTNPMYGETPEDRENLLKRGGLEIQTEIDPDAQDAAEAAVANMVGSKDPVLGVMTQMQPGTGLIISMAQSRPEMGDGDGQTFYNYAAATEMGGAEGYQMGSTFKPITATAAVDKGIPLNATYASPSRKQFQGQVLETCNGPATVGDYKPANSTRSGTFNMRQAMAYSVNTYFVQLEINAGGCATAQMADKLGLKYAPGGTFVEPAGRDYGFDADASMTLGVAEVTPISVTETYATLAARGKHCDPVIIKSMKDANGDDVKVPDANCKQVIDEGVADAVTSLLQGVMNGTGAPATIPGGYPQAGKTGTTDSNASVWFAGYTPEVAGSAMIAIDKTNPFWADRNQSLKGLSLPDSGVYLAGSGGGDAGQIYKSAMAEALKDKPKTNFQAPPRTNIEGKNVPIPDTSGLSASEARAKLQAAGFNVGQTQVYSSAAAGTYLGVAGSGEAKVGSTVNLQYSKGPKPAPKPAPETNDDSDEKKKEEEKKKQEEEDKKKEEEKKKQEEEDKKKEDEKKDDDNGDTPSDNGGN